MVQKEIIEHLKRGKNLLAFSGGVDSTALFFILQRLNIEFDIATVDYQVREEAIFEIEYAKELSKEFNKRVFIKKAPKFNSNFEANAREFRYNFFHKLIEQYNYQNLITAHQLNDKIEWFLMRFSKGAGFIELAGMESIEKRDSYTLVRPLLETTKDELEEFLKENSIKHFIDKTNFDKKYERNRFREISNRVLLEGSRSGFIRSFDILTTQKRKMLEQFKLIFQDKELLIFRVNREFKSECAVVGLKKLKYLISYRDRKLIELNDSVVVGRRWAVEFKNGFLFISPYIKIKLPKELKEEFRVAKIPQKVRSYIYKNTLLNKVKRAIFQT